MVVEAKSSPAIHQRVLLSRSKLSFHRCPRSRQVAQRVGVVDLAQHVVGQAYAIDSPASVQGRSRRRSQLRGMIEVLVESLEKPPVRHPKLIDAAAGIPVGAEQNAVLILQEKIADHARRAAQVLY